MLNCWLIHLVPFLKLRIANCELVWPQGGERYQQVSRFGTWLIMLMPPDRSLDSTNNQSVSKRSQLAGENNSNHKHDGHHNYPWSPWLLQRESQKPPHECRVDSFGFHERASLLPELVVPRQRNPPQMMLDCCRWQWYLAISVWIGISGYS